MCINLKGSIFTNAGIKYTNLKFVISNLIISILVSCLHLIKLLKLKNFSSGIICSPYIL